jgi:hypothetical protein
VIPAIENLLQRLDNPEIDQTGVIYWASPVPAFGDLASSRVATLGLNPSNREFVDLEANELIGPSRRFHTLNSLGLTKWADATAEHLRLIEESCLNYFSGNPYDAWFKELDCLLGGIASYYYTNTPRAACHLDIIPYATSSKWTDLSSLQRTKLLAIAGDTLGLLLRDSQIRILILNGQSVIRNVEAVSGMLLTQRERLDWTLPRKSREGIKGISYSGRITKIREINLGREVIVLGFNHNIQSSFGVTNEVKRNIRRWIVDSIEEKIA